MPEELGGGGGGGGRGGSERVQSAQEHNTYLPSSWNISLENVRLTAMKQGQGECGVLKNASPVLTQQLAAACSQTA